MGFERVKDSEQPNKERGFENADIDLESDELSQLKTVRAPKKRQSRSKVEVKTGMKRDRMGRRGYNNEESDSAEGADLIAPDRPIRIASGSRQNQVQYNTKPFKSENSEFGDLFDSDESQEYRADSSRYSRLDGLAYDEKQDGDGERFAHIFGDESASPIVHRGENMVQELMRERQREDEEEQRQLQGVSRGGSFGLAEERAQEKEKSKFSKRERKNKKNDKPEKQSREANKVDKEREQSIIQPNAEPYTEDQMAYPAQMPPYGYQQQPYGYPPYPQQPYGYPPYPQQPYGYPPYPQQPYGYPPYPQQPYGYAPYPQQPYGYPPYPQQPYGYPPYPQQPYGYPPMPEQPAPQVGAQPPQRRQPAEIMPPERPVPIAVPERPAEETKPAEQPALQPAAEPVKEAEPEQTGGSRFNRRSKSAETADAEHTPKPEEKAPEKAEEPPVEEPPAMPSKFTRRSKDNKTASTQEEPIKASEPAEPEMPKFERRNRNAPMDAEALSMPSGPSGSFGADDEDDMPMPVSRFKRRNRGGAPD